jgi:hypothetical protein
MQFRAYGKSHENLRFDARIISPALATHDLITLRGKKTFMECTVGNRQDCSVKQMLSWRHPNRR